MAGAAALAGVSVVAPTLGWMRPLSSWTADHHTGVGELRVLSFSPEVTVAMNTRSSLALQADTTDLLGIELIDGEIAVDIDESLRSVLVRAASGQLVARNAHFEVRFLEDEVCISCLSGRLGVTLADNTQVVEAGRQLRYRGQHVRSIDSIAVSDLPQWRQGIISFDGTTLSEVVREINRYRPGRLIVLGESLQSLPVSGRFRVGDLDKAIAQISQLFRLDVKDLPGGVVVLS